MRPHRWKPVSPERYRRERIRHLRDLCSQMGHEPPLYYRWWDEIEKLEAERKEAA